MYFYYRGTLWANNEIEYTREKNAVRNASGQVQYIAEKWQCKGVRHASSQSALITEIQSLESALSYNGGDVGIYLDDATTLTPDYIVSGSTLGGVRITRFAYPQGTGAEWSTFRTYTFEIEADHPITLGVPFNLEYEESVTFQGNGGPRRVFFDVLEGEPVEQIASQRTTFKAVQTGHAKATGNYPQEPPPIWPELLMNADSAVTKHYSLGRGEYTTRWNYIYESPYPLIGGPNVYY